MDTTKRIDTQTIFHQADRLMGKTITGQDFIMVITDYPHLTFNIKTNALPTLKNSEKIEYTTTHGVKTYNEGQLQTYNELSVTFIERDSLLINETLNTILMEDKNGDLTIEFFAGRTIAKARHWGSLEYASILLEEGGEADSEAGTTPLSRTATLVGHYKPSRFGVLLPVLEGVINIVK